MFALRALNQTRATRGYQRLGVTSGSLVLEFPLCQVLYLNRPLLLLSEPRHRSLLVRERLPVMLSEVLNAIAGLSGNLQGGPEGA